MKSIDHVMFGAPGTANASGLSRFNRLRGSMRRFSSSSQSMRFSADCCAIACQPMGKRVCGSTDGPAHCADARSIARTPKSSARPFSGIFNALSGYGRPDQQISGLLVLVAQKRAVVIARLADPEGPAGHSDADPASLHRCCGHLQSLRWPIYFFQGLPSAIRSAC